MDAKARAHGASTRALRARAPHSPLAADVLRLRHAHIPVDRGGAIAAAGACLYACVRESFSARACMCVCVCAMARLLERALMCTAGLGRRARAGGALRAGVWARRCGVWAGAAFSRTRPPACLLCVLVSCVRARARGVSVFLARVGWGWVGLRMRARACLCVWLVCVCVCVLQNLFNAVVETANDAIAPRKRDHRR